MNLLHQFSSLYFLFSDSTTVVVRDAFFFLILCFGAGVQFILFSSYSCMIISFHKLSPRGWPSQTEGVDSVGILLEFHVKDQHKVVHT